MPRIVNALENAHLLIATEKEELLPGREMTRIYLEDIMAIVRTNGETGSDELPAWTEGIEEMGGQLDAAISTVIGKKTLADLLDKLAEDGPVED